MKKLTLTWALSSIAFAITTILPTPSVYAQNTFPSSGNAGIGTSSPSHDLEIDHASYYDPSFPICSNCGSPVTIQATNTIYGCAYCLTAYSPAYNLFEVWYKNIISPSTTGTNTLEFSVNSYGQTASNKSTASHTLDVGGDINGDGNLTIGGTGTVTGNLSVTGNTSVQGYVVIGPSTLTTPNPNVSGGYSLYVANGILTEQLKVAAGNGTYWTDFVFAKDYKLKPLNEVETFVKANKHLPEIPSASEVANDGIDVAKMDAKLLQKIEELTLYVIQQQKEINELKKEVQKNKN